MYESNIDLKIKNTCIFLVCISYWKAITMSCCTMYLYLFIEKYGGKCKLGNNLVK